MEQPNSRLNSGPLSQAAQKILAVLQAQRDYSNVHRQTERIYDSQREPSTSCWESSMQREKSKTEACYPSLQAFSREKYSVIPAYPSSQAPSSIQDEVSEKASLSLRDQDIFSLDIPGRLSEHKCINDIEEIRPSFLLSVSSDDKSPDELLFPRVQHSNAQFFDVQPGDGQFETGCKLINGDSEPGERVIHRKMPPIDGQVESTTTDDSGRERCLVPTLSQECGPRGSQLKMPSLHRHHDDIHTSKTSINGTNIRSILPPADTITTVQNSSSVQDNALPTEKPNNSLENLSLSSTFQTHLHQDPLISVFNMKRKREALQHQHTTPPKICLTSVPEPPASPSHEEEIVSEVLACPDVPMQTQQRRSKVEERGGEFTSNVFSQTPASVTYNLPKYKWAKCGPDSIIHRSRTSNKWIINEILTSDPRVKDSGKLNTYEKIQMLEKAEQAKTLVLTMVYQDGTTQLHPEQKLTPPVCGVFVLMIWSNLDASSTEDSLGPNDCLIYLRLTEQKPAWAQQHHSQGHFTRDMLLQVLSSPQLLVCFKAKDLLCTTLRFYNGDITWKQVAGCRIQDPQVSGWLLDPADPSSCYQDLLRKHCKRQSTKPVQGTNKVSQVISGLFSLYQLNMELCSELQRQGLWDLYSDMELNMIPVLAAMESHRIHVDKDALKTTSDLLGSKMKQLEQEAHQAAGQIFLVTSSSQLRIVLFEKLRLHERCENKKLPKTINKQQQSTSEAALLQLQDLHPLPKIILEYRQIHKIKSTFVDGILSCMMSKSYISSTWYQTSVVTGRISAKHPNFQALPRQPLQITKKQYIQGKEEEVVTVHPRAMIIPQKGWTFLAADFCQVELRLLAHFSSDPELLRIFTEPRADVFAMLASQWKGLSEGEVTSEDREHAKRVVYSVVYGAGRERLSGILGVKADQASQFQDSFLQTYREVQTFIQRTIQLCHKQGYVLSIMGRRRTLPHINSPDWGLRMQAERQAVNFIVQGSAADLCKMAMIRIFNLISPDTSLNARLIAQLHDELLYEVEDSQVQQFAVLVKSTMESLQHIDHLDIHLQVPLKVAVSIGKSWGSMSELNISSATPTPSL